MKVHRSSKSSDPQAERARLAESSAFLFTACILILFVVFAVVLVPRASAQQLAQDSVEPQNRIDLSSLGFRWLSASARLTSQANMSLDFVDDAHVLLTFNPKKMFKRLPDCPPNHDDRIIHAVVLEIPSGKVVREADWYLHDHERYLWSLGSGRILLRRLNSLYLLDPDLQEKLLMASPQPFLWITPTPDGKQIIVERRQDDVPGKRKAEGKPAKLKVKIEFLDSENLSVRRVVKSEGAVNLEALSTGFADVIHGYSGKVWLVRFGPSGSERENITRVRSHCVPDVIFSSSNTLLVGRCAMESGDYSVSSFTVTGRFLWRQHWSEHRYTPKVQRSEDGSRVAVSSITRVIGQAEDSQSDEAESGDETDRGLQQHIQVLDTASGTQSLSLTVTPAATKVQNFALSPDGRTLVLVQGTTLDVHRLPEMSQEDRAKYIAAKADVPGLYTSASQLPSATAPEETTFASIDASEEAAREKQAADAEAAKPQEAMPANSTKPAVENAPTAEISSHDSSTITFRTTPRIVVEEVVVTDSKGRPVKGLHQQDFQLAEDGKSQNLRAFEEVPNVAASEKNASTAANSAPTPASAHTSELPSKLPPNIYSNNTAAAPDTGSATIIVLDLLNTPLEDQQQAREQLIAFIKKRPEASQMALCSLSTNLRLIQGFTRDENALVGAVLGRKGGIKAPPWQSDAGLERSVSLARDFAMVAGTAQSITALQRAQNALDEQKATDIDVRVRFTLDAFTQLARYLSGIPGRKNLVWLSGSFPLGIFPNPDVTDYEPVARNYEIPIKKATNLLAEAHVAVYPVNVKGAETQSFMAASNNGTYDPRAFAGSQGPSNPGSGTALLANTSASLPLSSRMDQETRQFRENVANEHSTMDQIAADTGGKAFYSNGLEDAIKTAVEEGSHYYTLSYTPANKNYDGAFRKIRVSLQEKGYHLAYRRGYYAEDPDAASKDTRAPAQRVGVAAMQQGSPQSRQIVFATRVVPLGKPHKVDAVQAGMASTKKKKGAPAGPVEMQHYGIDYAVDASDLRFGAMTTGTYHAVLSFMVTAFNDDGRLVASLVSTATNDLKPANYKEVMAGGFRIHQELDVPVEAVSLRLGVEDAASSHVGTLEIPLPVPVPPDEPQVATRKMPPIEPD